METNTNTNREERASRRGDDGRGPRILIENSEYWLRNNGDHAMLQVTIARLRARWPHAQIGVLTDTPWLLRAYFPDAMAITVKGADPWSGPGPLERYAGRLGPHRVGPVALGWVRTRRRAARTVRAALARVRPGARAEGDDHAVDGDVAPPPAAATRGSFAAVDAASLLLVLGGGYLTDADEIQSRRVFALMERAQANGVPVALVGQGLGPLTSADLRTRAERVLPKAGLIAVRERRRGPDLLAGLGVPGDRVMVTGDDAIELAYGLRPDHLGSDLGLCLRVAAYSPVGAEVQQIVGKVLRATADAHDATLAPLIISEFDSEDRRSTMPLVRGYANVSSPPGRYVQPEEVAARVARCRVMVTGAYHLAVFALSQGIPVVALTSTGYYDDKFVGLADMFGDDGMALVDLRAAGLEETLSTAIESAWQRAADVREPLREHARAQIATSRDGFDRACRLVDRHSAER